MTENINLPKVKGEYKFDAKIINWFDLKGRAKILFRPFDIEDLAFFLQNIDKKIRVQVIGAGSNVIIADEGVDGVLIKLSNNFLNIDYHEGLLVIGASVPCQNVAKYCQEQGLGGLEFLSGIPGNIGGAIAMNAGCYDNDISNNLISAKAVDYDGNIVEIKNQDFEFYYRGSKISKKFIFCQGVFKVQKSTTLEVGNKIIELQNKRELAQPIRAKTGGSTFKNPPHIKAWQLIDDIGFRGKILGGAQFSDKHCNFLININNATAKDLIDLGNSAKAEVLSKHNIDLEWEIKYLK
ncbi:MAG: UDP-N-acetylmuramate dehydrogenase [Rickettsiales bacterium]